MLGKKGIEMQFFWVFVMIAGALILLFFFSLTQRYRSLSEEKLAFIISNTLETIISEIMQSPDTVKEIPMPKAGVGFSCSSVCDCKFKVGKSSYSLSRDKILFGPGELKEKDLILWSKQFKFPYRIANFLYITNKRVLYIFVNDENLASPFFNELRKNVEDKVNAVFVSDVDEVVESGYLSYRFIFIGQEPGAIDDSFIDHDDVGAVYFSDANTFDSARFYVKRENVAVFDPDISAPDFYLFPHNLPLVLASIFSNDHQMFSCNIKEAFRKMTFVTAVYIERINNLLPTFTGSLGKCVVVNTALLDLNAIKKISEKLFEEYDKLESLQYIGELRRLISDPGGLERKNRVIIESGCPAVY